MEDEEHQVGPVQEVGDEEELRNIENVEIFTAKVRNY